jgi:hypothetical protein
MPPHERRFDPYREPSPPQDAVPAVLTCEEMRRSAGPGSAILLALAAFAIAWILVGH